MKTKENDARNITKSVVNQKNINSPITSKPSKYCNI